MPAKKKTMDRDAAIAAMLGGASENASKRGGGHGQRLARPQAPTPPVATTPSTSTYYDGDRSSGLRLVQVQNVAAATVLAPQSLLAGQELANQLKRLLHRGKEDVPDAAAIDAAAKQSPLLGSAASRGLLGLQAGSAKAFSTSACDAMRMLGVSLRADLVNQRAFLPPGIAEDMTSLALVETIVGGTESCVAGAQLLLEGLYPEACRAPSKLTSIDWDEDTSPLLQTSGGVAVAGNAFSVLVDVVTAQPAAAEAALDGAMADGLLAQLSATSPSQLAQLDDLLHCLELSDGLSACGAAGPALAGMVAAARTKRAASSPEAKLLADTLYQGFTETIGELASDTRQTVGAPRLVAMVAERDAVIGLAAALELELMVGGESGGNAPVARGDCIQLELWCDEAASIDEMGGGYLVTVSKNGTPVRSTRHFGALIPLQKLFGSSDAGGPDSA